MKMQINAYNLTTAYERLYSPCGVELSDKIFDSESSEYGACQFKLIEQAILYRDAKITPKKVGAFVTVWKRIGNGPIQPYDENDDIDFFIISVREDEKFGQFIFPKSVLIKNGVMSKSGMGGKRGIRVYPPWVETSNKQAKNTQRWQSEYFLEIPFDADIDFQRAKRLLNCR